MPMNVHRPIARRQQRVLPSVIPTIAQNLIIKPVIDWTNRPQRFMNPGELEVLCGLVAVVKPRTVVEFGVNVGRTAQAILEYVAGIESYVGVDVPLGYVTPKEVQRGEVPEQPGVMVKDDPRFQLLLPEGGSVNLSATDLPECDAVFIDGDHSREGVLNDTTLALQRLRPGGIVIWHDYHTLGTVDVRAVLDEKKRAGWPLHHVEGTWLVYMRG